MSLCVEVEAGGRYGEEVPCVETVGGEGWLEEGQRAGGRGVVCGGDEVVLNAGYSEKSLEIMSVLGSIDSERVAS